MAVTTKKRQILVTGGGGFIGRYLCRYLVKGGFGVTVFDNLSSCTEKAAMQMDAGIRLVRDDITNYPALRDAMRGHWAVVHLAAKTRAAGESVGASLLERVNVTGSYNVVKGCTECNVNRLVAASSAAVYGNGPESGQQRKGNKEDPATNPISHYGKSKLEMEHIIQEFSRKNPELKSVILRLFNVYGERDRSDANAGVIRGFVTCAQNNRQITIFGDGTQTRDFIHVDDVVRFMGYALENIGDKRGEVYDIGTGRPTSINELAGLVLSTFGRYTSASVPTSPEVCYVDPAPEDIRFSTARIARTERELRYSPTVGLDEGIARMFSQ